MTMIELTKENINIYLSSLSKELKKEFGKNAELELIIVGGASLILNYDFRKSTMDIDAINSNISSINACIHKVADTYNLPYTWLNSDFKTTASYSPKLIECSKLYKKFGNVLSVYTIKDEYLLCMKLVSFRLDKDTADVMNLLDFLAKKEPNGLAERIDAAMIRLYNSWDRVLPEAILFYNKRLDQLGIQPVRESVLSKISVYKAKMHDSNSEKQYNINPQNYER